MPHQFSRMRSALLIGMSSLLVTASAHAQHMATSSAETPPPREAAQFDFLIGDWELIGKPVATTLGQRIHGVPELRGTWKARRELDGRVVEDELRLTDRAGNPRGVLRSMRVYDAEKRLWINTSLEPFRPSLSSSTAEWRGGEMIVTGGGTDADARAFITRSRYFEIKPSSFRFQQERSYDGGRSWSQTGVKLEAKRTVVPTRK